MQSKVKKLMGPLAIVQKVCFHLVYTVSAYGGYASRQLMSSLGCLPLFCDLGYSGALNS